MCYPDNGKNWECPRAWAGDTTQGLAVAVNFCGRARETKGQGGIIRGQTYSGPAEVVTVKGLPSGS